MELILLAHVVGDFYLQTDKIADKKTKSLAYMLIHCLLYTFVMGIMFFLLKCKINQNILSMMLVFISHFGIDCLKQKFDGKNVRPKHIIFLVDQTIHILVLIIIMLIGNNLFNISIKHNFVLQGNCINKYIFAIIAFLICWKPAGIFVSLLFQCISEKTGEIKETKEAKIGFRIGVLEIEIILILGLMGQFGAIGFVLTAKSLARFRQLEDKEFAEKYLIGTLLSTFIAIICVAIYKLIDF